MREKLDWHADTMALAILLWLCSLPLITFLVLPFFGLGTTLLTALALLVVFLILCWGVCLGDLVARRRDR